LQIIPLLQENSRSLTSPKMRNPVTAPKNGIISYRAKNEPLLPHQNSHSSYRTQKQAFLLPNQNKGERIKADSLAFPSFPNPICEATSTPATATPLQPNRIHKKEGVSNVKFETPKGLLMDS
jgi:hypothetical protein